MNITDTFHMEYAPTIGSKKNRFTCYYATRCVMTMLCNRQRQLLNVCAMRIGTLCDDEQTRPKKHRKPQMMTANIKLLLYFSIFIFRLFFLLRFSLLIFNHQMLRKHHSKRINGLIFQIKVIIKRDFFFILARTFAFSYTRVRLLPELVSTFDCMPATYKDKRPCATKICDVFTYMCINFASDFSFCMANFLSIFSFIFQNGFFGMEFFSMGFLPSICMLISWRCSVLLKARWDAKKGKRSNIIHTETCLNSMLMQTFDPSSLIDKLIKKGKARNQPRTK